MYAYWKLFPRISIRSEKTENVCFKNLWLTDSNGRISLLVKLIWWIAREKPLRPSRTKRSHLNHFNGMVVWTSVNLFISHETHFLSAWQNNIIICSWKTDGLWVICHSSAEVLRIILFSINMPEIFLDLQNTALSIKEINNTYSS